MAVGVKVDVAVAVLVGVIVVTGVGGICTVQAVSREMTGNADKINR